MKLQAILFVFVLGGCTYGYDTEMNVTNLSTQTYTASAYVPEVFWDDGNIRITKPYQQLGMIEVKGVDNSTSGALLHDMKTKGSQMGADAIINVKQHYISREKGVMFQGFFDSEYKPDVYSTIALTGIAIKYK